jgi:hypothetical protein
MARVLVVTAVPVPGVVVVTTIDLPGADAGVASDPVVGSSAVVVDIVLSAGDGGARVERWVGHRANLRQIPYGGISGMATGVRI